MSMRLLASIILITAIAVPEVVLADCAALNAVEGASRILITGIGEPMKNGKGLHIKFSVLSSMDASLSTGLESPGEVKVKLLEKPFFSGVHTSLLRCEHGVCATIRGADFSKSVIEAQASLFVDCPDAGVSVGEVRLQFSEVEAAGKESYVPLMSVRPK